jgi:hypothetical protein
MMYFNASSTARFHFLTHRKHNMFVLPIKHSSRQWRCGMKHTTIPFDFPDALTENLIAIDEMPSGAAAASQSVTVWLPRMAIPDE